MPHTTEISGRVLKNTLVGLVSPEVIYGLSSTSRAYVNHRRRLLFFKGGTWEHLFSLLLVNKEEALKAYGFSSIHFCMKCSLIVAYLLQH